METKRTIIILTVTNPATGRSYKERTANVYHAKGMMEHLENSGYKVTYKIGRAKKYERSVEDLANGVTPETLKY